VTPAAISRVGLVVHAGRPAAVDAAEVLAGWFAERGVTTRARKGEDVGATETRDEDSFADALDLVVSVGGDGTLLRAAEIANRAGAPLLGVKVGRLGFLTEVEPDEAAAVLERALAGALHIEERMAIVAEADEEGLGDWLPEAQWALNEVFVEKHHRHRLVTLASWVDGDKVTTFSADGVIVATPTGSTAYSFSARGPIVFPRLDCLLLTPVSPHMVFDRAIVLAPDQTVVLEVQGDEPGILSADGRPGIEMPPGARVRIGRADRPARLVRRDAGVPFFSLLREKFGLPDRAPADPSRRDVGPDR
jgi:NAD+ kinase